MCGISGIVSFNDAGRNYLPRIETSIRKLAHRGPDNQGIYKTHNLAFGHRRLSIIDLSKAANQPFIDQSGRYVLVYNGELYNYLKIRKELQNSGVEFRTESDTEVLLQLLILKKEEAIKELNGFFAFAFYDLEKKELLLARDRFGIKPLHYSMDSDKLIFASEIKSILAFGIRPKMDDSSMFTYLQLTYIPPPFTIYKGILKLMPGHYIKINENGHFKMKAYYDLKNEVYSPPNTYADGKVKLNKLLTEAVEDRLVADVKVGSFLSGGIDSSIIAGIAAQKHPGINTFSMGFEGESFYDETAYAEIAAKKFNTNHTSYKINQNDMLQHFMSAIHEMDEPFADSSALAVSILSEKTASISKVALSGDGADEIFGGYNKHKALMLNKKFEGFGFLLKHSTAILKVLPQSRSSSWQNKIRQLRKLSENLQLSPSERYWFLASFQQEQRIRKLLSQDFNSLEFEKRKQDLLSYFNSGGDEVSSTLLSDLHMVLPGDMLTKVDNMSMQHSLEVRLPFLDHRVVELAFSLPTDWKVTKNHTKRILRDTFSELLPKELLNRPKHGFEVPLDAWFKTELSDFINNDLLSESFIKSQGIFNYEAIRKLKFDGKKTLRKDSVHLIWTLIVFNNWWKNNYSLHA